MPCTVIATTLPGAIVLEPSVFGDARGWFYESFNARDFAAATGLSRDFVQDNQSGSTKGVLRGLHYQVEHAQGKLVRAVRGEVFDVAVDLRQDSTTFGKWFGTILSAENRRQLWLPEGFAHGYLVLSDWAEVAYKTTDYWYPEHERALLWNDPSIGIEWPLDGAPVLSAKDIAALPLARVPHYPSQTGQNA